MSGPEIWSVISGGWNGWIVGPLSERVLQVAAFLMGELFKKIIKSKRSKHF
jgi:hypothetical protein